MKIHHKILSTALISVCLLSQHAAYAAPVNAYVGASIGFQRGSGPLKGETLIDGRAVGGQVAIVPYSGHIGQSDPAGNLFFEIDSKFNNCFSIGLRPYYHLDAFEATLTRNGDLSAAAAGFSEIAELSMRRRHAYGLLFVPKMHLKEATIYGLIGAEFSRFKAKINRTISGPGAPTVFLNFTKGISSSAAVFGLGISRELGNWSLFVEGQYKHYQAKRFNIDFVSNDAGPTSQSLKTSPKFASVMFGVKFKII